MDFDKATGNRESNTRKINKCNWIQRSRTKIKLNMNESSVGVSPKSNTKSSQTTEIYSRIAIQYIEANNFIKRTLTMERR